MTVNLLTFTEKEFYDSKKANWIREGLVVETVLTE